MTEPVLTQAEVQRVLDRALAELDRRIHLGLLAYDGPEARPPGWVQPLATTNPKLPRYRPT